MHKHRWLAYKLIVKEYGDRCAKRSGVRLMNHIDEGLDILRLLGSSELAMQAFCVHPLVQLDSDLAKNIRLMQELDGRVVALAMEYRRVANAYLSPRSIDNISEIELSPLKEVNDMLRADKIQNRKDFDAFHKATHPRSKELDQYFANWFKRLDL